MIGDNPTIDPNNFFLSTADLKITDPRHGERLVATQANLTSLVSYDRKRLVYATDAGLRVRRID